MFWLACTLPQSRKGKRKHIWDHTDLIWISLSVQKVIPSIKEQWLVVKTSAEPHLQSLSAKTIEVFETSKTALAPHVLKVQEIVDPYFQVFILNIFYYLLFVLLTVNIQSKSMVTGSKTIQQTVH